MEKTASEWFDMLIEPYCSQAKENAIYHGVYKDLHTAICAEFSWELTPSETQGDRYWRTVYKSILNKETTYLKPTEPAQPQFGEWVKVEDGLPLNDDEVLVFVGGDIVQAYLKDGKWKGSCMVTDNMNDGYVNDRVICMQGSHFDFITHWMPLPSNPKE